ncbi:hypothetical protein L484_009745 [Morus notabilis]|uniref:Endonuclease/exonuclease/phosphatase domain-containing protein n=1 Tax=Morus notabilis TaxID=981085 RepID=W9QXZ0_9ROSA|nr:hypothetical protein L484_009745 [Morus notabilis]
MRCISWNCRGLARPAKGRELRALVRKEFLEAIGGIDLGCFGSFFTWKNGRDVVSHIREWLDRVIGSAAWCNSFPRTGVKNLNILSCDHTLIMLDTYMEHGHLFKLFHFFEAWSLDPSCREVIVKAWEKVVSGVESFTLRVQLGVDHCWRRELEVINCLFSDHKRDLAEQYQVSEVVDSFPSGDHPSSCNILSCDDAFAENKAELGVVLCGYHGNVLKRWLKYCEASSALDAALSTSLRPSRSGRGF